MANLEINLIKNINNSEVYMIGNNPERLSTVNITLLKQKEALL